MMSSHHQGKSASLSDRLELLELTGAIVVLELVRAAGAGITSATRVSSFRPVASAPAVVPGGAPAAGIAHPQPGIAGYCPSRR